MHTIKLVYVATLAVTIVVFILSVAGYAFTQHPLLLYKLLWSLVALAYIVSASVPIKLRKLKLATWMLVALYATIGALILFFWGASAPIGVLLLGFSIFIVGITQRTGFLVLVTIVAIVILFLAQIMNSAGVIVPSRPTPLSSDGYLDFAGFSAILAVFAVLSLFSKRMREKITKNQKSLHHFAELGQLSAATIHELANHFSVLSMDIEDLGKGHRNSKLIQQIKSSINNIERTIQEARLKIGSVDKANNLDLTSTLPIILDSLSRNSLGQGVAIKYSASHRKSFFVEGDSMRLSQIITVIINNSIDAYQQPRSHDKTCVIDVGISIRQRSATIYIRDYGPGISRIKRSALFSPQRSQKTHGMGVGLFIAKEMIETHFNGTINIDPSYKYTQFNIVLPKQTLIE